MYVPSSQAEYFNKTYISILQFPCHGD